MLEAGWKPEAEPPSNFRLLLDGEELLPTRDNIEQFGLRCVAALQSHEDAPSFVEPVNADEVPDYYDVIQVRGYARRDPTDREKL